MKRFLLMAVVVLVVAVSILGFFYYDYKNRDFTEWMDLNHLTILLKKFDAKPGEPDTWQKTHWITAAEGRWHDGAAEYRVRYGTAPKEWEGYWFFDQDQELFSKAMKVYGDTGFTLAYHNSFTRPDGSTRYQSVWHKNK